jgi:hypothetical protein
MYVEGITKKSSLFFSSFSSCSVLKTHNGKNIGCEDHSGAGLPDSS